MAFSEQIRLVVDVVTSGAKSSLSSLRTDLAQADGAFGKMRVAGAGAFDFLKQNAAQFAMLGGTAIAGFAAKAVADFQATALGAGELRDALGVTADEASRFQEVAADIGLSSKSVETALGRMNRAAADTPEAFDAIGAAIARNADGTVNVTETFVNASEALKRIPDATQRAAAAQKIFGRGWQEMSEIIMLGADGIRDAMASVEAGKIIDDAEIQNARNFRDTMDELRGVLEEVSVTIGGELVPALADAGENVKTVVDAARNVGDAFGWIDDTIPGAGALGDAFKAAINPLEAYRQSVDGLKGDIEGSVSPALGELKRQADRNATAFDFAAGAIEDAGEAAGDTSGLMDALAGAVEGAWQEAETASDKYAELLGTLDANDALRNAQDGFDDLQAKMVEAYEAGASGAADAEQKARDAAQATDDLKREVIDYADELGDLPPEVVSEILALIDRGLVSEAEDLLNETARKRDVRLQVQAWGVSAAEGAINAAARPRDTTITVQTVLRNTLSAAAIGAAIGGVSIPVSYRLTGNRPN